jgi:hypothetical protein
VPSYLASQAELKELTAAHREESARMCDNIDRANVRQVALLALTDKDIAALEVIIEADGRLRNYAVLIRRLIAREAKRLEEDG